MNNRYYQPFSNYSQKDKTTIHSLYQPLPITPPVRTRCRRSPYLASSLYSLYSTHPPIQLVYYASHPTTSKAILTDRSPTLRATTRYIAPLLNNSLVALLPRLPYPSKQPQSPPTPNSAYPVIRHHVAVHKPALT